MNKNYTPYEVIINNKSITVIFGFALLLCYIFFFTTYTWANHTPYGGSVNKFELSGNTPVSIIDNFDDGSILGTSKGTLTESGGALNFSDPGEHSLALNTLLFITLDRSNILLPITFNIDNGAGNFIATSTWTQTSPDPGESHTFALVYPTGTSTAQAIVSVYTNIPSSVAGEIGFSSGLQFFQGLAHIDISSSTAPIVTSFTAETTTLENNDINGDILMVMSFDDTANTITTFFSSDNGITMLSPFTPINISSMSGQGIWELATGQGYL